MLGADPGVEAAVPLGDEAVAALIIRPQPRPELGGDLLGLDLGEDGGLGIDFRCPLLLRRPRVLDHDRPLVEQHLGEVDRIERLVPPVGIVGAVLGAHQRAVAFVRWHLDAPRTGRARHSGTRGAEGFAHERFVVARLEPGRSEFD